MLLYRHHANNHQTNQDSGSRPRTHALFGGNKISVPDMRRDLDRRSGKVG